ncbi:MAG: GDSL-type esterase/lipase family protein, partial [Pseudomonadota bacterium]
MRPLLRFWFFAALAAVVASACGGGSEPDAPGAVVPPTDTTRVDAASTESEQPKGGPVVVMLGDSLVAGFNLPLDEALPAQIEARLAEAGVAANVINAGVSGDTTAGGLARYEFSVRAAEPDLLVLALGANDFLGGVDAARARENLTAILRLAADDDVPVVLFGLGARSEGAPREAAYAQIYPALAETFDAPL